MRRTPTHARFREVSGGSVGLWLSLLLAAAALWAAGCAAGGSGAGAGRGASQGRTIAGASGEAPAPADDWGDAPGGAPAAGGPTRGRAGAGGRPPGGAPSAGPAGTWAIVLGTYTGADHASAAATMLTGLSAVSPELRGGAWVQSDEKGSKVVYGRYVRPDDPAAQKDLDWVKTLTLAERPVFPRAMLAVVPLHAASIHPLDIVNARRLHPDVKPLYSLQVAVWGDFESGALRPEDIRAAAIKYAQELRSQGYEAWFSFNEASGVASVTVGLFDHRAIDSRSNLYSPEVEALVQKFPKHLVNGEPLLEPVDLNRPRRYGTRPQQPRLVLVPE